MRTDRKANLVGMLRSRHVGRWKGPSTSSEWQARWWHLGWHCSVGLQLLTTLHSLTTWSRVHLGKLTGSQLVKTFPEFYGTRRFITALTWAHHLSPNPEPYQSSPCPAPSHFLKIHLNIILPSTPGTSKVFLKSINSWCTTSFFSQVLDLLRRKPHWWCPIMSSAYGVKLDSRMLDKILYVRDKWYNSIITTICFIIPLKNTCKDRLLPLFRQFLLIPNKICLWLSERISYPLL
jgi:hypothetical protein